MREREIPPYKHIHHHYKVLERFSEES